MQERDPHARLDSALRELYGRELPGAVPRRWERFADVAILPAGAFASEEWAHPGLWPAVALALGAGRLARMGEVTGELRESGVEMLVGDDDWVVRRESGVDYGYRMSSCMFSAGNVNERRRMGEVTQEGEVVVDLYAGIGYYTLPALVHGGASVVHACEWNPEAVRALRWGLDANGVADRCVVHEGDNRESSEHLLGCADRVILGLLPSAEEGMGPALRVLGTSGELHVHGLAPSTDHSGWESEVLGAVARYRPGSELSSSLTRVKSYAPHWDHVVADVTVA